MAAPDPTALEALLFPKPAKGRMAKRPTPDHRATVLRGESHRPVRGVHFASAEEIVEARRPEPQIDIEELQAELEARAEQAARDGYQHGMAEGYVAGRAEGLASIEAMRRDLEERLRQAWAALATAREQLTRADTVSLRDVEAQALDLAYGVAEAVLGRELAACDDPVRDAVARAAELLPERGAAEIHLHPTDAVTASETAGERLGAVLPGREYVVLPDPSVEPGGAVVIVGACRVDAQIGPALERVREVLSWQMDDDGDESTDPADFGEPGGGGVW